MTILKQIYSIIFTVLGLVPHGYAMHIHSGDLCQDDYAIALALQEELDKSKNNRHKKTGSSQAKRKTTIRGNQSQRAKLNRKPTQKIARRPQNQADNALKKTNNDIIKLPKELAEKNIVHLKVNQQGSNQCGSHAALNARSIQILSLKKVPITSKAVQEQNRLLKQHIKPYQLTYDEVRQIAQDIDLDRTLIVAHNNGVGKNPNGKKRIAHNSNGEQVSRFYVSSYTPDIDYIANSLESFFVNICKHLDLFMANNFHFICNTGGHWICISVVKQNGTFNIFYCDSSNVPIFPGSRPFKFVSFIHDILFS